MNKIFKYGYKINENFYLGQRVVYNNEYKIIIGFNSSSGDVALNGFEINALNALNTSILATHILEDYKNETHWSWCSISEIRTIEDKKERSFKLKFDTKELQEKLEKAIYHLKEFNNILDDLNSTKISIQVKRSEQKEAEDVRCKYTVDLHKQPDINGSYSSPIKCPIDLKYGFKENS